MADLNFEAAIDYIVDGYALVGSPSMYSNKVTTLTVREYRTVLPCDCEANGIRQVRRKITNDRGEGLSESSYGSQVTVDDEGNPIVSASTEKYEYLYQEGVYVPVRPATDTFQMQYKNSSNGSGTNAILTDYTYSVNNGVIYTNFDEGCIEVSYYGIATDEEGFPLIPDNTSVKLALENYVKFKHYQILKDLNKIPGDTLDRAEREYTWYIGQANSSMNAVTPEKAEVIGNTIKRLILDVNQYNKFFSSMGQQELLYRK